MSDNSGEKLFISCREATYLISRDREKRIGMGARFRLMIHLFICVFCRRFSKQTRMIEKEAGKLRAEGQLTADEKQKMEKEISDGSKKGF